MTKYVGDEAFKLSRSMEARILSLPKESGVIFVSVKASPADLGNSNEFEVVLGLSRKFDESYGRALLKRILLPEVDSGKYAIKVKVVMGVSPLER